MKKVLEEGIVVVSLFDGMSCGQLALKKAGVKIKKYYAAEIDKHASKVTTLNFPGTIQLGDVTKWKDWNIDWCKVDLILAGSPCQGFSFAGKQLAFNDTRSALFFVFVEILEHCKKNNPNVKFLLENVKMKKEFESIISKYMGIAPIEINSALLSAQNRVRLYWTNIANEPFGLFGDMQCNIPQPKDKGILLRDILENDVPDKYYLSEKYIEYFKKREIKFAPPNIRSYDGKASCIMPGNEGKRGSDMNLIVASRGRNPENQKSLQSGLETEQHLEPRFDGKTNCLTSVQKDNLVMQLNPSTESNNTQPYQQNRIYSINGISPALVAQLSCKTYAILVPEATKKGFIEINPGECFDSENINSKTRRGRKMTEKSNCLMAKETDFMQYAQNYKIRRLTPTECERLQTVPDGYTSCVSDTQRYKMLGNGWTVDVVAYIFSFFKV